MKHIPTIAFFLWMHIAAFGQWEWFYRFDPARYFLNPNESGHAEGFAFVGDNLIHVVGGVRNFDIMDDMYVYDPVNNSQGFWPLPTMMPPYRRGVGFTLGNTSYFGLGHGSSFEVFDEIFSYTTGWGYNWPPLVFPGGARHSMVSFAIGGKAYIGGGRNGDWQQVNDLWEFDPTGPTWTPRAPLVGVPDGGLSFVLDGVAYVIPDGTTQLRAYDPMANTWTVKAPYPGGVRTGAVAFAFEGKGWVGTGLLVGQRRSDFHLYDPATDSWSPAPHIWDAYGRDGAAAVNYNGRAYVLGGRSLHAEFTHSSEVWELGPPQPLIPGTWVQRPFLPGPPRTHPVTFTIGNRAYVGGGSNVNANWALQFFAYDPVMREWTPRAQLPAQSTLGAAVDGIGYILTGGATGNFWAYDPLQDSWSPRADMPSPRANAVAFGLMGKIYIATGILDGVRRKDIWAYDPQTDTWEEKTEMPGSAVHQAAAFALPDRGCVMGGNLSGGSTNTSQVRCYHPALDAWTNAPSITGNTNLLMGFSIGNTGYRAGGIQATNFISNMIESFDPVANTWTQQTPMVDWRAQGGTFGLMGSGFVVAGRVSPNNNNTSSSFYYNDLWEYITWESYADDSPSGRLFLDEDDDCVWSDGDAGVPGQLLLVQPGDHVTSTAAQGQYGLVLLPPGDYTITPVSPYLTGACGDVAQPFTMPVTGPPPVVDIPVEATDVADVMVSINSGFARVGMGYEQALLVKNLAFASSGAMELMVERDPVLQFQNASVPPTTVNGNTLTWQLPALAGQAETTIHLQYQVPANVELIGHVTQTTATVTIAADDADPSNNSVTHLRTITAAYDPNDKLATTSMGNTAWWYIGEDQWIDYTIRFQNTGTDTAFNVLITDTLPANLDPATLVVGAASHAFTWDLHWQGILRFHFNDILLPDSNVNEPLSHGFVGFRIRPHLPLLPGDEIINIANIHFDYNPPVITEPSVLTVVVPPLLVDVHAFLGGPYDAGSMSMTDALRTAGLLPLQEPYTVLGYPHTGLGGDESTAGALLAQGGAEAIVDWVLLELRDASDPAIVLASRSALIRRDGRVVEVDGSIGAQFHVEEGPYHIAIRHRNHLGCMTTAPVALSQTIASVDFTSPSTATWGTEARKQVDGTLVLWPGDANFNGEVKYTGAANDRDRVLVEVGGNVPSNVVPGYGGADINLDGDFKYVGEGNDRDMILQTIGGMVPTAVKVEQLP